MKYIQNTLILFSLFFLIGNTGCKTQGAGVKSDASTYKNEKALLWKVTGKKVKKESYVFGTIHMIPSKDYFLPEYVDNALKSSDEVFFEINTDDMNNPAMMMGMMNMMFMEDKTLKDLLNEEDYKLVKEKLNDNPLMALLGEQADRIKPMFLSSMMDQGDMGIDPLSGGMDMGDMKSYEMELTKIAKAEGKPIDGLETLEFQMGLFDKIDLEDQAKMLVEAIRSEGEDEEGAEDTITKMVELYKMQDVHALYSMINAQSEGSGVSEFEDQFLTERNKNWIPLMAKTMSENTAFFAVGAGHLGGKQGVLELLRKEGYTVTPVLK
ncbi:MAG: TraB/GumN family protein [Saprospiraceae bacterium]